MDILRELFPNVQFIATSHSPFIIQAMREGEIIVLDDNDRLLADGSEMSNRGYITRDYAEYNMIRTE